MNIGKTIKRLRRERNMTQEKLADYLNISPQAVSRWENGLAMPDLTLIPIIAKLFNVSTDLILGMDDIDVTTAVSELIKQSAESESAADKNFKSLTILRNGVLKYPNSWQIKSELLNKIYLTYASYKDEFDQSFLDEAVKTASEILDNCTIDAIRYSAIEILSAVYSETGKKDDAIKIAYKLPQLSMIRDKILIALYDGNEKYNLIKENIASYAQMLCLRIRALAFSDEYNSDEKTQLLEKIIKIYHALLESETDRDTEMMCDVHRYLAAVYADAKNKEKTLYHLNHHADILLRIANNQPVKPSIIRKNYKINNEVKNEFDDIYYFADELLYKVEHERYDFIRQEEEFLKFTEKLERILDDTP